MQRNNEVSKEFNIQDAADKVGKRFVKNRAKKALDALQKQMEGTGCGYSTCLKRAVRNANQWGDFVSKGTNESTAVVYWDKSTPKIRIRKNPKKLEDKKWKKD